MFQCTSVQSGKPCPSALPDAVIQFNPPRLSFNPNYALKPPRSCLLQSHNTWRAAVSSRRLMWWKRRQLQSHKTALISSLTLMMWRWKDAAPLVCAFCCPLWASDVCYCTTGAFRDSQQQRLLLYFNFPANTFVSLGGVNDCHQRWAAEWRMNSSSSVDHRRCWDLQR